MPYSSNSELPDAVKNSLPSAAQSMFREVANSQLGRGRSEKIAMASAWAAVKRKYKKGEGGKWVEKCLPSSSDVHVPSTGKKKIKKYQISDDQFTMQGEAMARADELGLNGETHIYQVEGQAVYMPGATHEDYLKAIGHEEVGEDAPVDDPEEEMEVDAGLLERAIRAIISAVTKTKPKEADPMEGKILKTDDEQRLVWGWASVATEQGEMVTDLHDDQISPDTLVKAATAFMLDVRLAKTMHEGGKIGEVVHSLPLTNDLADALGIVADREGWIIAMKIHDDEVWKSVKSGELAAFSIGGKGVREEL